MMNESEIYAAFMLIVCPYDKHWVSNNTNTLNPKVSDATLKYKGNIKNGMDIRWHTKK